MNVWPTGILAVVQIPFTDEDQVDFVSREHLVGDALDADVDGLLVPAVASENAFLSFAEKMQVAKDIQAIAAKQVPIF